MPHQPIVADWTSASASCTLPTAERPLRRAEFNDFFQAAVRRCTRSATTRLDLLVLPDSEDAARDLAERESGCCSFFRFDFEPAADGVLMRIGVPDDHVDVLDALETQVADAIVDTPVRDA